jgi:hypothetical protein
VPPDTNSGGTRDIALSLVSENRGHFSQTTTRFTDEPRAIIALQPTEMTPDKSEKVLLDRSVDNAISIKGIRNNVIYYTWTTLRNTLKCEPKFREIN